MERVSVYETEDIGSNPISPSILKICSKCGDEKSLDEFYDRKNSKDGKGGHCKVCNGKDVSERARRSKEKAIAYLGGKCSHCGYNKCSDALEFHHQDRALKSFDVGRKKLLSWKKLVVELDKCTLLCSNCHKEEESLRSRGLTNKAPHF